MTKAIPLSSLSAGWKNEGPCQSNCGRARSTTVRVIRRQFCASRRRRWDARQHRRRPSCVRGFWGRCTSRFETVGTC